MGTKLRGRHDAKELQAFLKALMHPKGKKVKKIKTTITKEDLQKALKIITEKKSSSPSGLHFGIWKAIGLDNYLSEIHATMLTLPFQYGFTYPRWQQSIHTMLLKEDYPLIHRLRIIQLFEADFNLGMGLLFSRRLMPYGEKLKLYGEQAIGGRKGHAIPDLLIKLQLTAINSELGKYPVAYCFNDQAGNFDRLRPNVVSVAAQRIGMTKEAAMTQAATLAGMQHRIRTAHGDSKEVIQPQPFEIGGVGQGNRAGVMDNHIQSIALIDAMSNLTKGATMRDPTGTVEVIQHICGWVDDCTNTESFNPIETAMEIINTMSQSCKIWRRLVRITGGDLALHKCVTYIVIWKFTHDNTKAIPVPQNELPGKVSFLTDDDPPQKITLKSKDHWEAERITGIRFTPTAAMNKEFKHRKTESLHLARNISKGHFTSHDANMIYHSRWQSRISFFLPMTTFTKTQCHKLQIPIYAALLPKFGYNRHIPLEVRHGPRSHGGSGLIHMYTEQGIKHLQQTLGILRQTKDISKQLQITLSNYQQHIGTHTLFLNLPIKNFRYKVKGRIAFLWKFCNEHKITFDIKGIWRPPKPLPHDYNLMEYLTKIPNIAEASIQQIEACRLYLQVSNLSEVTTEDGKFLNPQMITPPHNFTPTNKLHWPYQPRPGQLAWSRWENMLKFYFCLDSSTRLKTPITKGQPILSHPTPTISTKNIPTLLSQLPQEQRSVLQNLQITHIDETQLHQLFIDKNIFLASDGSVTNLTGTYGYLLSNFEQSIVIEGMGLVPTTATPTQSQRSEYYGAYALTILIKLLNTRFNIQHSSYEVYIDNQNVVDTLNEWEKQSGIKQHTHEDYDIWDSIQTILQE